MKQDKSVKIGRILSQYIGTLKNIYYNHDETKDLNMTDKYSKEEHFLRVLANTYITHNAHDLLKLIPDDFGFDTMWRFESKIETKKQYEEYIKSKLWYMSSRVIATEFAMMKDKRDGKPLLLITNSTSPDGGHAVIVATSDEKENIKRADITVADFYPLEPMTKDNVIKRTHETLLHMETNCKVSITTSAKQVYNYNGIFLKHNSLGSQWGLAHLDDVPDNFCAVYDHIKHKGEVIMFTPQTRIFVDFVFIDSNNQIIKIHKNAKPLSREKISCENVAYVLELKAGQCEKNDINVGDTMNFILK